MPRSSCQDLDRALELGALTARGYGRVLRLAWTLADLAEVDVPGRELHGVVLAMDYLTHQNRVGAGLATLEPRYDAAGKRVLILGGGDTGSDCLGTALRQGAALATLDGRLRSAALAEGVGMV